MEPKVSLRWITPNAESEILYCARVSNPTKQDSTDTNLIKYLIDHKHWSPFQMACASFGIVTYRGIVAQFLRHRAFNFQEFSQRYAKVEDTIGVHPRRQDTKNRQNSIDDLSQDNRLWWDLTQQEVEDFAFERYNEALERGIAKECARFLLPTTVASRFYMMSTLRDWMHYIPVRTDESAQKEHRDIAEGIKDILKEHLPVIAHALEW